MSIENPKIIIIGGGTGPSFLRKGLKRYTSDITSVLPITDSGGSTGKLRKDYKTLAWGDITKAIADQAIDSEDEAIFRHRFINGHQDEHRSTNIWMVAVADVFKDRNPHGNYFLDAIEYATRKNPIVGKVFPASVTTDINMISVRQDGSRREYEHEVDDTTEGGALVEIGLSGVPIILPEVESEIRAADIIIISSTSIHANVETILQINGIPQAIRESRGLKVMFSNIANVKGQTNGFTVSNYAEIVYRYLNSPLDDFIYYSQLKKNLDPKLKHKYEEAGQDFVKMDNRIYQFSKRVHHSFDLVIIETLEDGKLVFRHDPVEGSRAVMKLWQENLDRSS